MFKTKVQKALGMMQSMKKILSEGIDECKVEIFKKVEKRDEIEKEISSIQSNEDSMKSFLNNLTQTNGVQSKKKD